MLYYTNIGCLKVQWEHLLYQEVTSQLFHFHEAKPNENGTVQMLQSDK